MPPRITNYTRDALAAAFNDLLGGAGSPGVLRFYEGTVPSGANEGAGSAVQLASLTFLPTAFTVTTAASSQHGTLTLTGTITDYNTDAAGTPDFGTVEDALGNKLMDFLVPTDLVVPEIEAGGILNVAIFTLVIPELSNSMSGDITGDGFVGQADLDVVLLNWGQTV